MSHIFLVMECVFCNFHSEDDCHLFMNCPFTYDVIGVLNGSGGFPPLPRMAEGMPLVYYLYEVNSHLSLKSIRFYAIIWWFIWYANNSVTFRQL